MGAAGEEPSSLLMAPGTSHHLPPPFDSHLGLGDNEMGNITSPQPASPQRALLSTSRFFTPKQGETQQFKQSYRLIFIQSILCFLI